MSEEIDIIELLKRVKENKAPKEIEINNYKYIYNDKEFNYIEWMYYRYIGTNKRFWIGDETIKLNTKIKILDKSIIDEISDDEYAIDCSNPVELARGLENIQDKINKIIRVINNKE